MAAGHPSEATAPMIELKVNRSFIGNLILLLKLLYLLLKGGGAQGKIIDGSADQHHLRGLET